MVSSMTASSPIGQHPPSSSLVTRGARSVVFRLPPEIHFSDIDVIYVRQKEQASRLGSMVYAGYLNGRKSAFFRILSS